MINTLVGPGPADRAPAVSSDDDLPGQLALVLSRRFRQLGESARRGGPEATAFGVWVSRARARLDAGRVEFGQRTRVNPIYLAMLEMGLLGPDEITAAVVAKLAVGLGHALSELPLTPYPLGEEPADAVEVAEGSTTIQLGLETLVPWVDALVRGHAASAAPAVVRLPECQLQKDDGHWTLIATLSNSSLIGPRSDEYAWRVVRQSSHRGDTPAAQWTVQAQLLENGQPVEGRELALEMGERRHRALTDRWGHAVFERLDPHEIEPIRWLV